MTSLTSILPILTNHLGLTPAALYERQRALVRLGLLQKPKGRGRGSGASATPHTIGLIILSVLATDNLSEMDDRISVLAKAPIDEWHKRKQCRLTKKKTFLDALAEIIQTPDLAKRVQSVDVQRRGIYATIFWTQVVSKKLELSRFNLFRPGATGSIQVTSSLNEGALSQIAAALQAEGVIE